MFTFKRQLKSYRIRYRIYAHGIMLGWIYTNDGFSRSDRKQWKVMLSSNAPVCAFISSASTLKQAKANVIYQLTQQEAAIVALADRLRLTEAQ